MQLLNSIVDMLSKSEGLVLATILSRTGSAPRAAGTRMIVRADGSVIGTIGGGILEAQVQRMADEVFSTKAARVSEFLLTAEEAGRTGMICGGAVEVLMHFVSSGADGTVRFYRELAAALSAPNKRWLITTVPTAGERFEAPQQWLLADDGRVVAALPPGCAKTPPLLTLVGGNQPTLQTIAGSRFFVEPMFSAASVYIFGAGHISQQLAPLTRMVGFKTIVLDDREEFANRQRFANADQIIVLESFENGFRQLHVDENSYLVLVTRGHAHDKTVLSQALKTAAGYIGMIGSRNKRDAIYAALRSEGFTEQELERVHSPIGLAIGAETPEEIAVSIVAELIRIRSLGR